MSEPCIMKPIVVGVAPRIIPFIPCMSCISQTQPDLRHTALSSNTQAAAALSTESKALGYGFSSSYMRAYLK